MCNIIFNGGLNYLKNAKEFLVKIVTIIILLLLFLSLNNAVALYFGIRPQTVISYAMVGTAISYVALKVYDKAIAKKEDPLPDYVLKEVQLIKQENNLMKELIEKEYNTSIDEIRVRAKVRESLRKNEAEDNKGSQKYKKET